MASTDYIYRRTVAGHSAVESDAPIAPPLRRVLGLIEAETHLSRACGPMSIFQSAGQGGLIVSPASGNIRFEGSVDRQPRCKFLELVVVY